VRAPMANRVYYRDIPVGATYYYHEKPDELRQKTGNSTGESILVSTGQPYTGNTNGGAWYIIHEPPLTIQEKQVKQDNRFFVLGTSVSDNNGRYTVVGESVGYPSMEAAKQAVTSFVRNNPNTRYTINKTVASVAVEVVFKDLDTATTPVNIQDVGIDL
jgi:hypothetical protein